MVAAGRRLSDNGGRGLNRSAPMRDTPPSELIGVSKEAAPAGLTPLLAQPVRRPERARRRPDGTQVLAWNNAPYGHVDSYSVGAGYRFGKGFGLGAGVSPPRAASIPN